MKCFFHSRNVFVVDVRLVEIFAEVSKTSIAQQENIKLQQEFLLTFRLVRIVLDISLDVIPTSAGFGWSVFLVCAVRRTAACCRTCLHRGLLRFVIPVAAARQLGLADVVFTKCHVSENIVANACRVEDLGSLQIRPTYCDSTNYAIASWDSPRRLTMQGVIAVSGRFLERTQACGSGRCSTPCRMTGFSYFLRTILKRAAIHVAPTWWAKTCNEHL